MSKRIFPNLLFALLISCLLVQSISDDPYNELYRPGYHFSPPQNWMNDPNGLLFFEGEYHLFYQYNPDGSEWGNMSWGHAISTDLVHWQNLDVALTDYSDVTIFSGSAVADFKNSSGFCTAPEGCMIAFYTANSPGKQAQALAYSNDHGRTWTEYPGNPVIDENMSAFRDPKVFWDVYNQKWVMVTVLADIQQVRFYTSQNLVNWTRLSEFGPEGLTTAAWECPDLYLLNLDDGSGQRWVLSNSVAGTVQYFVGEFNGTNFINSNPSDLVLRVDYGMDWYAAVTWNNLPNNRRLMIAWFANPGYAGSVPTSPWRGESSLIHEFALHKYPEGIRLIQKPIDELQQLRTSPMHADNVTANNSSTTVSITGIQLELIVLFQAPTDQTTEFGVKVLVGPDQETVVGYNVQSNSMFVNRTISGDVSFDSGFPVCVTQPLPIVNGTVKFHIFVDQSSVEVFANDGQLVVSNLVFPDPTQDQVEIYAVGGTVTATSVDGWGLSSIWSSASEQIQI